VDVGGGGVGGDQEEVVGGGGGGEGGGGGDRSPTVLGGGSWLRMAPKAKAAARAPRTCVGCRSRPDACRYTGPRCQQCYLHTRQWRACEGCGEDGCCQRAAPPRPRWLCPACGAEAGRGSADVAIASDGATPGQLSLLVDWHLREAPSVATIWLVPCTNRCSLVLARLVLWRRWGCFAGLLRGPPAGVLTRGGGRHGRKCRPTPYGSWLQQLRTSGGWPAGDAPILLTGVRQEHLEDIRSAAQLASWAPGGLQMDFPVERLCVWSRSLSRNVPGVLEGWCLADFLANPLAHSCEFVLRAGLALDAAGVQRRQPRSLTSATGRGFLRSLHVPAV